MPRKARKAASGHTILVIDDREEALISLRALLEREGHRIVTAQSGTQALALFSECAVDLVVVDYLMPRMTGIEFIREVRRQDPLVRIILHTGYVADSIGRVLDELRVQGCHDKSDGPEGLLTAIRDALSPVRSPGVLPARDRRGDARNDGSSHEAAETARPDHARLLSHIDAATHPRPAAGVPARRPPPAAEHVDDILLHATMDAGILRLDPQWVGIRELAQRLCQLASRMLRDTGVCFTLDLQDDVPTIVHTDREKALTVLRDLLFAAIRAQPRGLRLRIARDGGAVRFAVLTLEPAAPPGGERAAGWRPPAPDSQLGPARQLAQLLGGELAGDGGSELSFTIPVTDQGQPPRLDPLAAPAHQRGHRRARG